MDKTTEGEKFWKAVDKFEAEGYSHTASLKAAREVVDGKEPHLPARKNGVKIKRVLPEHFRDYLRPFIKDEYGEEQVEIDIGAIIQYLEDN